MNPGSAAEKAGVQVGDFIVSAAGSQVTSSQDLLRIRRQFHVGDELPLILWRDGAQVEVTLSLQAQEETGGARFLSRREGCGRGPGPTACPDPASVKKFFSRRELFPWTAVSRDKGSQAPPTTGKDGST